jgi:tRNA nucleotidyltransferase (CCA-adding enzyme)
MLIGAGATPYFVGGCVRDAVLGNEFTDFDIEIFSIPFDGVERALGGEFAVEKTGKAFCVLKLRDFPIDVSVPRSEVKLGDKHTNFHVNVIGKCDVKTAASRRDFTINSLYFDVKNEKLVDEFGGIGDLRSRILRHVGEKFSEDQLRVLRGMQFAGRFCLRADEETIEMCKNLSIDGLSKERIFSEWEKLILQGTAPSFGLRFIRECGWLKFFPQIYAMDACMQDPKAHPEGSVFDHTCMCLDVFAKTRTGNRSEDRIIGFAALCHDMGKPLVTTRDDRGIHHYGHAEAGVVPASEFLRSINAPNDLISAVIPLVLFHMSTRSLVGGGDLDSGVLHLANSVGRMDRLLRLCRIDLFGRGGQAKYDWDIETLLTDTAQRLGVLSDKPVPIIRGRHLEQFGLSPSEKFSKVLGICFSAQLDRKFTDFESGMAYLQRILESESL